MNEQFNASIVDYLHVRKFPYLGQFVKWFLRLATTGALTGVYMFNTNDIGMDRFLNRTALELTSLQGLTELIRKLWTA